MITAEQLAEWRRVIRPGEKRRRYCSTAACEWMMAEGIINHLPELLDGYKEGDVKCESTI